MNPSIRCASHGSELHGLVFPWTSASSISWNLHSDQSQRTRTNELQTLHLQAHVQP